MRREGVVVSDGAETHGWLSIRLPAADKHRLRVLAARRDIPLSELMRELVTKALSLEADSESAKQEVDRG